jgi:hypothetical protein
MRASFGVFACIVGCGSGSATVPDGGAIQDGAADHATSPDGDAAPSKEASTEASTDASTTSPTGVIVPLYTYPTDGTWDAIIQSKKAHPTVPIVAVINPNSGPGTSKSSDYATGITNLQSAGVTVIGYVPTGYATASYSPLPNVEGQISDYATWYPTIEGIFFDEMSNDAKQASYYQSLATYVASKNLAITVGNPGANVPEALLGILTNLVIYESGGFPSQSKVDAYYSKYGSKPFSFIAYGVSSLPTLATLSTYVRWLYVTDLDGSNPYGALPRTFPPRWPRSVRDPFTMARVRHRWLLALAACGAPTPPASSHSCPAYVDPVPHPSENAEGDYRRAWPEYVKFHGCACTPPSDSHACGPFPCSPGGCYVAQCGFDGDCKFGKCSSHASGPHGYCVSSDPY